MGVRQLKYIDSFNKGAHENATLLTELLGVVPGMHLPAPGSNHIYVYYPIEVAPDKRDGLRRYLLRHGIDGKITDMSDCSKLDAFHDEEDKGSDESPTREAALLEICVYPVISTAKIHRIARAIKAWAEP
jgi:dTDP-4-amino-4,6-dideoxygalactose transaminase